MASLYSHDETGGCKEAGLLIVPVLLADPGVTAAERAAFEAHLTTCSHCRADYDDARRLVAVLKQPADLPHPHPRETAPQASASSWGTPRHDQPNDGSDWHPTTPAEPWEDLKRRCPSLAEACRRQQRRQWRQGWFGRIGSLAAAASILVAIGTGWWLSQRAGTTESKHVLSSASALPSPAFAELVTPQGRKPLALNQPVRTGNQPQEVLLGGTHRVAMNRHTEAAFTASPDSGSGGNATQSGKIAYEVQLARGELYVEVAPGHPFLVRTANARLEITGTRFNVRAEGDTTELVLLKGSVRFSRADSPAESVNVTAGCMSAIAGQSRPSAPCQTDAVAATAWGRNLALSNALAPTHLAADPRLLDSIRDCWPPQCPTNLDSIDYATWREDHRDWFAREFPWIFKTQKVLKEQHGIDVDYVELLMVSGDVWQFHYPRALGQPIAVFNTASVTQAAEYYNVRPATLLDALPTGASRQAQQTAQEALEQYRASMQAWRSAVAARSQEPNGLNEELLVFTLRAGKYLTVTRTAAWLWIKTHPAEAAPLLERFRLLGAPVPAPGTLTTYQGCLERLRSEVASAASISRTAQVLITTPKATGCEGPPPQAGQLSQAVEGLMVRRDEE